MKKEKIKKPNRNKQEILKNLEAADGLPPPHPIRVLLNGHEKDNNCLYLYSPTI